MSGIAVPGWQCILEIAARACDTTGLGYLEADLVLDRAVGPVLLELNARPALAIQLANRDGLLRRLQLIEAARRPESSVSERVELSLSLLGQVPPAKPVA